jgi:colanic acid biosynthesis glycosyl transferase WcaI
MMSAGRERKLQAPERMPVALGHCMRVLVVTQYFWPEQFRVNDLVVGLRERGHEVTVLTGMPNYPQGRIYGGYGFFRPSVQTYEGATVIRVPLVPRGSRHGFQLALNYLSFLLAASLLGPLRCRGKYDLVFVFEPSPVTVALPGIVMKWLKHAPMLFWVQDLWPESLMATGAVKSGWILTAVRRLVRFIYRRSDLVLIQSEAFRERIAAEGVPQDKILYFPNWAESAYQVVEAPAGSRTRSADMPSGFVIMFAGNIGVAQSFETILMAAKRLCGEVEIRWVVIGDGNRRAWLEQQIEEHNLGSQFRLLGSKPVTEMPRYFRQADVLVATLRKDPVFALTIPSKVQSYLACGRPIICGLDGEGAKVIDDARAGLTVPAGDSEALAAAVRRLYRMPKEEREAMGRRGRSYYEEHFERELLLDRLEKWMRQAIAMATA